jgi:hypothetical protein
MTTYIQTYINIINILYDRKSYHPSIKTINLSFVRCSAVYSIMRAINIICISSCTVQQLCAISMPIPPSATLPSYLLFSSLLLFVFFSLRLRPCHPFSLFTQPGPGPDPARAPSLTIIPP